MANQHGFVRGLDSVSDSSISEGLFGRLFRNLDPADHDEAALIALGETMISGEFKKKTHDAKDLADSKGFVDNDIGEEDDEENVGLHAGYTYLGQFIDHDITFDPASSLDRDNDPDALHNFRTPRLDLDSLYGSGPDDQPFLYEADGVRLRHGANISFDDTERHDLPRNGATPSRALIGDKRNDENRIISQMHALFIQFHNAAVGKFKAQGLRGDALLAEAQRFVRWHYQKMVVTDYLPTVCGQKTVKGLFNAAGELDLKFFRPKSHYGYLPVEFSGACFRFGHSMVRPSYFLNEVLRTSGQTPDPVNQPFGRGDDAFEVKYHRIPIFSLVGGGGQENRANLNSFDAVPDAWAIDWAFFFEGVPSVDIDSKAKKKLPQPSYKIDSFLVDPLRFLPDHAKQRIPRQSLANLNLLRGNRLRLPSGQAIAKKMGLVPLSDEVLFSLSEKQDERKVARKTLYEKPSGAKFKGSAPLWYYILCEAEALENSKHLGPVGGRIVAEVLLGLIAYDRKSYLQIEPKWKPALGSGGVVKMSDIINFAQGHEAVA